jgi:hypothetical protein
MDSLLLDIDHRFVSQKSREFLSFCIMWQVLKSTKFSHFVQFLPSSVVSVVWTHASQYYCSRQLTAACTENVRYLFGFMWINLMAVTYEKG